MIQLIATTALFIALSAVLLILIRSLPRVHEHGESPHRQTLIERFIASEIPERIDAFMASLTEKTLRKLKVFLLKADNTITIQLQKIRPNGNGKPKIDLSGIAEEKAAEQNGESQASA